jgi:hypothetical protein
MLNRLKLTALRDQLDNRRHLHGNTSAVSVHLLRTAATASRRKNRMTQRLYAEHSEFAMELAEVAYHNRQLRVSPWRRSSRMHANKSLGGRPMLTMGCSRQ